MAVHIRGRRPTIPEYYREYIDSSVDLTQNPWQCCPFHKENAPSFSYSAEKGVWRCFGGCKVGGDVVALHQKNYKLESRQEAEESLDALYDIVKKKVTTLEREAVNIDLDKIDDAKVFQEAILLADRPERWNELDYVMSKFPISYVDLQNLIDKWRGK